MATNAEHILKIKPLGLQAAGLPPSEPTWGEARGPRALRSWSSVPVTAPAAAQTLRERKSVTALW